MVIILYRFISLLAHQAKTNSPEKMSKLMIIFIFSCKENHPPLFLGCYQMNGFILPIWISCGIEEQDKMHELNL